MAIPFKFKQYENETKADYLKRLNNAAFRCAACRQVYSKEYAIENYSICKGCKDDPKFFERLTPPQL